MFSTVMFSQGLVVINVTNTSGSNHYPTPPPPTSPPPCTDCFLFDISFSVSAPVSTGILNDIALEVNSATGDLSGYDNSAWIEFVDTIDTECIIYTYRQEDLSICFETDPSLCPSEQNSREEIVEFQLTIYGDCLADYLNSDPLIDYFDQGCVGLGADSCDPTNHNFYGICCEEMEARNSFSANDIDLKISPNPCIDNLYIENLQGGEELIIYSRIGKKLKSIFVSENTTEQRIRDLKGIPSGLNFLHVAREGKIIAQIKFVKQ